MPYKRPLVEDFERSRRDHKDWPVVMSEGDSWFSFSDSIGQLDDPDDLGDPKFQRPWCLLRLEQAGDEVMTILSGSQRSKLRSYLGRWPIDAFLFSGGGNDIIGPDLLPLLRPYSAGAQAQDLVSFSRFERRLRQIQDCYRELLDLLADASQKCRVFVNSYDYVIPSNKPVKLLGLFKVAGPWMLPYFKERGIPGELHSSVVRLLIDGFCAAVDQVGSEPRGIARLVRVETRGVVQNSWKDEIHPNRKGAKKVAKAFEDSLRTALVIR